MRFVSKYHGYKHEIQMGVVEPVLMPGGYHQPRVLSPHLVAEFDDNGVLTYEERTKARAHFDAVDGAPFSGEKPGPYRTAGIITGNDEELGEGYFGSEAAFMLSLFDTENELQCPKQHRKLFEQVLTTSPDLGHTIIRVDDAVLPEPFPGYDKHSGAGADKKIAALVRDTTGDFASAIEYEKRNGKRAAVIKALEAEAEKVAEAAKVDKALSGTVG